MNAMDEQSGSYAVVFHINEAASEKHAAVCHNIVHLLQEIPNAHVELVIQGAAIPMAVTSRTTVRHLVSELRRRGVVIAVCANSMRAQGVLATDLLPDMTVVPAAVAELVYRQAEGMAYIKA